MVLGSTVIELSSIYWLSFQYFIYLSSIYGLSFQYFEFYLWALITIFYLFIGSYFNILHLFSLSKCSRMILGMTHSDHKCKYPSPIPMYYNQAHDDMGTRLSECRHYSAHLRHDLIMFISHPVKLSLKKSRSCLKDNWQCLSLVSG